MLSMARALTTDPQILFLDELSMGLAPLIVEELYGVVDQLVKAEHLTIVMVEQFVQTALSIADHAVIMVNGRPGPQREPRGHSGRGGRRLSRKRQRGDRSTGLSARWLGCRDGPRGCPLDRFRTRCRRPVGPGCHQEWSGARWEMAAGGGGTGRG